MSTNKPIIAAHLGEVVGNTTYTFTLNSFKITDTRSRHEDTDFVAIAVAIGNNPPITSPTKSMGDLNNGTFQVNLSIPNVSVPAGSTVAFSYTIVNTGFDKNTVEQDLSKAVGSAATAAASEGLKAAGAAIPVVGPIISVVGPPAAAWAIGKLEGIIFADCDGTVAAGDHVYTGAALANLTAGNKVISATDENKGTNSPTGCGGNSHYFVTWSIAAHTTAFKVAAKS